MSSSDFTPPEKAVSQRDPWSSLSRYTSARIAQGRAGGSCRTESLLDFRLAHARARDAVMKPFDAAAVEASLKGAGFQTIRLTTGAGNRASYLANPHLGRQLSEDSKQLLMDHFPVWEKRHLAILVSDGLSALAAERHAVPTLARLLPRLEQAGWSCYPVFVAPLARVALQDEVGQILQAQHTLMLLGERPGLGSPDSLGAYFTFHPVHGRTDADRNCLSNIRAEGFSPADAADKLAWLLLESERQQCSGVQLKDTLQPVKHLK